MSTGSNSLTDDRLERLLGQERLRSYVECCADRLPHAVELYRWNAAMSAALWQPLGHLEVALRNALSDALTRRHARHDRPGSWLGDPSGDLDDSAHRTIAVARQRVRRKGKPPSDSQTISELSFGFWRFLITRRHTALWPDLASAFPGAPDRRRETVEDPIARLHDLRNRIAHHQRIWNRDLAACYTDVLLVAGYLDAGLPTWIAHGCHVPALLRARPAA
jgi:hypothetical protein